MKKISLVSWILGALLSLACLPELNAQNPDAILTDFKAFSFYNDGLVADSIFYNPQNPEFGPIEYLADTLDIFADNGAFTLGYLPADSAAFVGIWVDINENGLFEKDEQIYTGQAVGGGLDDNFTYPSFTGSRRALVAISETQEKLADPREIPANSEISSLEFIMRAGPPTLVMGSKKGVLEDTAAYCKTIPLELFYGPAKSCISVYKWLFDYPVGNTVQVNTQVTIDSSGNPFAAGTLIQPNDHIPFTFDFSGFPVNDGDQVVITLEYTSCDNPGVIESISFTFFKDCTTAARDPRRNRINEELQLRLMPNPVRAKTQLTFELETAGSIQLSVFDVNGRRVEILQDAFFPAGEHQMVYAAESLPAGIYWLYLQTPNGFISKKMIITDR